MVADLKGLVNYVGIMVYCSSFSSFLFVHTLRLRSLSHLYRAEPIVKYYLHRVSSGMTKGSSGDRKHLAHHDTPVFHWA